MKNKLIIVTVILAVLLFFSVLLNVYLYILQPSYYVDVTQWSDNAGDYADIIE